MNRKQGTVSQIIIVCLQYEINSCKTSLKHTVEVSGREDVINYSLPPNYSFAIWRVIYVGILLYACYGLRKEAAAHPKMNRTVYPITLSIF
jgi:hypothetical protein